MPLKIESEFSLWRRLLFESSAVSDTTARTGCDYDRVKFPLTDDTWEYGYFSREQLEVAGAYRVDVDEPGEPYPDGGDPAEIYETELAALEELLPDDEPEPLDEE